MPATRRTKYQRRSTHPANLMNAQVAKFFLALFALDDGVRTLVIRASRGAVGKKGLERLSCGEGRD